MKQLAAILLSFTIYLNGIQAQIAPEIILTDLNGQNHDLYSKLEEGKIVIIAFFSTQSAPSLAYHTSNSLSYLYNSHGPSGDNKLEIYYVEGDAATSQGCILGNCSGSNNLNWTDGINFPIFNNHLIAQTFGVTTFPSIFIICPDKNMKSVPALSSNLMWESAQNCPVGFGTKNAGIFNFSTGTPYSEVCGALTLTPKFRMTNLGNATLTSATMQVLWNNELVKTINWNGDLQKYDYYDVDAGSIVVVNDGQLKISLDISGGPDEDLSNNELNTDFFSSKTFNDDILTLKIRTDEFGYETYWEFRDEFENVLQRGGNLFVGPLGGGVIINSSNQSPGSYPNNTTILKDLVVPHNGCFSFHIVDAFGDGLTCASCSPVNSGGYYRIYNKNQPNTPLISGSAFTSYERHYFRVNSSVLSAEEENLQAVKNLEIFPNPVSTTLNIQFNATSSQPLSIAVYNTLGIQVYSAFESNVNTGINNWSVPLENWPSGIYNFVLSGENSITAKQFNHLH